MCARPDWTAWRPGLTLFALCLLPLTLPSSATTWLEYRRDAVIAGEVWRLWSAHFVHYSVGHAVLDGLSCLILTLGLQLTCSGRGLLPRIAVIAPVLALVILVAAPEMAIYRGASGIAMALLAALWLTLWRARPGWRSGLLVLAAAVLLKIAADAWGFAFAPSSLPDGIRVAWEIHLAGLICGVVLVWRSRIGGGDQGC